MTSFKDKEKRDWSIKIDYLIVEAIEEKIGFNILQLTSPAEAAKLTGSKLLNVYWLLCEQQANDRKMSREDFVRSLDGDAVEAAGAATENALINFSQSRLQPTLKKLQAKNRELMAAAIQKANALIDALDPEKLLASSTSAPDTSSPESAELIPAGTHSES